MLGVCGAIKEVNFLEIVGRVVEEIGDGKLGSTADNSESAHESGLGYVIVSSTQVEVAADRKWSGQHPAPVVTNAQRSEGGIRAAGACCVSISRAASASYRGGGSWGGACGRACGRACG